LHYGNVMLHSSPRATPSTSRSIARRVALIAGIAILLLFGGASAQAHAKKVKKNFFAHYEGDFFMSFGTGPGGTHELTFQGDGFATKLGFSTIDGESTLQSISPVCMEIVDDGITLVKVSENHPDEVHMEAAGIDCLDFSDPNQLRIVGSGTTEIVGGTGKYHQATGSGTFAVVADVLELGPGTASGTFVIDLTGTLKRKGHHHHDDDD
jgi:hypothetical protein